MCVVGAALVLNTDENEVTTNTTLAQVVLLEVECVLSEAVAVGDVMDLQQFVLVSHSGGSREENVRCS